MAVENLKSTAITNLDATPIVAATAGEGATGILREVSGYQTGSASASIASTYQFVRVPTNAVIKSVVFESEAQGATGAIDLGVYYSSSTTDGTPVALQGTAVDQDFFASAIAITAAVAPTEEMAEAGFYTLDLRNSPLWEAVGLSSDPGGFFDIVGTLTAALTAGTGKMGVSVRWAE